MTSYNDLILIESLLHSNNVTFNTSETSIEMYQYERIEIVYYNVLKKKIVQLFLNLPVINLYNS